MAFIKSGLYLNGRVVSMRRVTAAQLLGAMAMVSMLAGSASASAVKYNPAPTTSTGWKKCSGAIYPALRNNYCATNAFFGPMSLTTKNPDNFSGLFGSAFNAWNNTNNKSTNPDATTKQGWTLTFGGDPGGDSQRVRRHCVTGPERSCVAREGAGGGCGWSENPGHA